MNENTHLEKLTARPFEPFVIVTNAGERYEVRHPEMAKVAPRHVYVFAPRGNGLVEDASIVGLRNISALEPVRSGTA